VLRLAERFGLMAAFLVTGVLIFVSAARSLDRKAPTPAADGNDRRQAPAAQAGRDSRKKPASTFVANPFCEACHADFEEEELALAHEVFGIGCERCHGESFRHRSDEANVTPPEIMYPKEKINPTCMMCHPRHDIRDIPAHRPILEASLSVSASPPAGENDKKYCTDCHGSQHQMKTRTIRWDKYTGALLKKSN
jgi:hypothetical protein